MAGSILYLESFSGIAGDMFAAAFLDAELVDREKILAVPSQLGFEGVSVEIGHVMRADARFTSVSVVLPDGQADHGNPLLSDDSLGGRHHHSHDHGQHHEHGDGNEHHHHHHGHGHDHHHHHDHNHHHYGDLIDRLESSSLPEGAKRFALEVFRHLAEAEAQAHGVSVETVAFHEVGAMDSVVDVAMAGVCIDSVSPDRVLASPVKLGRGMVDIHHGTYPVPPPASARLVLGMPVAPVPDAISRENVELSTPTGLAILKALDPTFVEGWPSGTVLAQGAGAGTMNLDPYPNVFRVVALEEGATDQAASAQWPPEGVEALPFLSDPVVEIRCNVDDQTGERTGWLVESVLGMGALDGWVEPVTGKKGRPAIVMAFLARDEDVARISDFLLRESTTFGVRYARWDRLILNREMETRDTDSGSIAYKVGRTTEGEVLKEKPEFDDLRRSWEQPGSS